MAISAGKEWFIYLILIVVAGGLSLLLVTDILAARSEREELAKPEKVLVEGPDENLGEPTPIETAIAVFKARSDLFGELVTPRPTATKPPEPTATPTQVPLAEGWEVLNIVGGKAVQLLRGDKKKFTYREGAVIPPPPDIPVIVIHRIEKDRVFLINKINGAMGWLLKGGGVEYTQTLPP